MLEEERQVTGNMGDMYRKSQGDSTRMLLYTNVTTKGIPRIFVTYHNGQSRKNLQFCPFLELNRPVNGCDCLSPGMIDALFSHKLCIVNMTTGARLKESM